MLEPSGEPIFIGNSGTSMRLLTSVAALGKGKYTLTGTKRMSERPIQDLLDGLNQIGVCAESIHKTGAPPIEVHGRSIEGGMMTLDCRLSSQYLSSVLLISPYTEKGLEIEVAGKLVSRPYVDMTIDIMEKLGINISREGYSRFKVPGKQMFKAGSYEVESDCSQASYFWGAAALTGKTVKVKGVSKSSRQGDVRFADVLGQMGCEVKYENDGISVTGKALNAVHVDMSDMPDVVPTLAVVAAFADGTTVIENVAHLKEKECDRLGCVANELVKLGVTAKTTESGLVIEGGQSLRKERIEIDTYDDHRMAMSFAIAGLILPGVMIKDEKCVEKSFPNYWEVFEGMYDK